MAGAGNNCNSSDTFHGIGDIANYAFNVARKKIGARSLRMDINPPAFVHYVDAGIKEISGNDEVTAARECLACRETSVIYRGEFDVVVN